MQVEKGIPTFNSASASFTSTEDAGSRADERVSLAPLDPETALRGLLATPPSDDDDH